MLPTGTYITLLYLVFPSQDIHELLGKALHCLEYDGGTFDDYVFISYNKTRSRSLISYRESHDLITLITELWIVIGGRR